jgi:peptidoglycan/xylan/chitin deacetylase (PgdA/CDA1 family)
VRTDRPIAALTFDDGPDEYHTVRILEVLARHDAKATFFVLAQRAARYPEILSATRAAGHEIALHGDDHSPLVGCSAREKVAKIRRGKSRLEALLGEPVRFFRPPYGYQDVRSFLAARTAGLKVIGWTAEGGDWLDLTPGQVADRAMAGLAHGSILLLHDRTEPWPGRSAEMPSRNLDRAEVVERLFQRAATQGVGFVPVGGLLAEGSALRVPWFWRPVAPYAAARS